MRPRNIVSFITFISPALAVTGAAEGFAKGVTGGGSAKPVTPSSLAELVSFLGDASPRVIHLTKTFDFTGSEGTVTEKGCSPWGTGAGCQLAINANGWCGNNPLDVKVTYDKAGVAGIRVTSNKSLVGIGNKGIIKGKGLRMANGVQNVIVQNVHITGLNPQYVWGGDAITLDGTDMIWIDHVTTSLIGRQHIVLGNGPSGRVTISNCKIDGRTSWSATCNGYHYWGLYFTGSNDLVTFKNNYIYHTSGRSPKVAGNTMLHAVNNFWHDNSGHAFELSGDAKVLVEGSIFQNVADPLEEKGYQGKLFTSPDPTTNAQCRASLGRGCQLNAFGASGSFKYTDAGALVTFKGKSVASAQSANGAKAVMNKAGIGTI
ncbi:hypothetical protein PWT90_05218 [Aphanocladium album]|nr:hypothetical protein PWT90_05218 [Aphanocladium album]